MTTGQPASQSSGALPSQRTLVIVPTFNERENLPLIAGRIHNALPDVHVLIVDDGSPDGTGELADELALADPDRVHVMHRTTKAGLGAAYLAGFAWGLNREYSVLVEMDADGSHPPEQLHRLLDAVDTGADLAIGSRAMDRSLISTHESPFREFAGIIFNKIVRIVLRLPFVDTQCGFKLFRGTAAERLFGELQTDGFAFDVELLLLARRRGRHAQELLAG